MEQLTRSIYGGTGLLAAGIALAAAVGAPGRAEATTAFNQALLFTINPSASGINDPNNNRCCDQYNIITTNGATAAQSYSRAGDWGNVSLFASANLSTGELKASAAATTVGDAPYVQTNAAFGDGFITRAPGGAPFAWSGQTATFSLALDGNISFTPSQTLASLNSGVFVILAINPAGSVAPDRSYLQPGSQYFFWQLGGSTTQIFYTDRQGRSTALSPTARYDGVPGVINATFSPGGDFDWVLLLGAAGQPGATLDPLDRPPTGWFINANLADTLTASYQGPDGSETTSVSGLFNNFLTTSPAATAPSEIFNTGPGIIPLDVPAVPEPASMLVLGAGLLGLGLARRERG